jgi:hypothetical protein
LGVLSKGTIGMILLADKLSPVKPGLTTHLAEKSSLVKPGLTTHLAEKSSLVKPGLTTHLAMKSSPVKPGLTTHLAMKSSLVQKISERVCLNLIGIFKLLKVSVELKASNSKILQSFI